PVTSAAGQTSFCLWTQCAGRGERERPRLAGGGVRARPPAPARGRLPHARLVERGGRRGPGVLAAPRAQRFRSDQRPSRVARHGRRAHLARRAPRAPRRARGIPRYLDARAGDCAGLLAVLDPSVVLRSDGGGTGPLARPPIVGAEAVARRLQTTGPRFAAYAQWIVVNGGAGVIVRTPNQPPVVVAFTVSHRLIAAIDLIADPAKLTELSGRSPSERGVSTG